MASAEASEKERHAQDNLDLAIIKKAKEALRYKNQVSMIRSYHEELLEARIRFLEAESDVEGLEERNRDIVRQQAEEQQKLRDIEAESQQMKSDAKAKQNLCLRVFDLPDVDEEMQSELTAHAQVKTVQELNDEISAEESKLDYIHTNNPNAIRDFETRQAEVDKLKVKIEEAATRLERIARKITRTREKWEPELDKLIGEISDAFSYNFEQIGCAGEVSVHKDDDFDLWSIQIKVKFR
jgi:chromosome segregation ATPase